MKYNLIIFDADGTLRRCTLPGQVCPNRPGQWELLPGVAQTLAGIEWGSPARGRTGLGIASNQAGIARGYLTEELALRMIENTVESAAGFRPVRGSIEICPHGIRDGCPCRKPNPLLLKRLMDFWGAVPEKTLFVGDMESDQQAARGAGCHFRWAADFFAKRQSVPGGPVCR